MEQAKNIRFTVCRQPGCANLIRVGSGGWCDEHRKKVTKQYNQARDPDIQRLYNSVRWKNARKIFLDQHPLCECEECIRENRTTAATLVDHKIEHHGDLKLFWDKSNWTAMSLPCHNRKHKGSKAVKASWRHCAPEAATPQTARPLNRSVRTATTSLWNPPPTASIQNVRSGSNSSARAAGRCRCRSVPRTPPFTARRAANGMCASSLRSTGAAPRSRSRCSRYMGPRLPQTEASRNARAPSPRYKPCRKKSPGARLYHRSPGDSCLDLLCGTHHRDASSLTGISSP